MTLRRGAAIWLLLLAAYASTVGIRAFGNSDYGGDEPHYLLTAESIVSDGDVDLADQYRERAYAEWYPGTLDVHGSATNGQVNEPHGLGFPLLIAPAYAIGGPVAVELFLAAVAALGFVLAIALARRLVPEPYATAGPLITGLSPPALAYSTAVYPELAAGTLLAGACLLALRVRDRSQLRSALVAGTLLAVLPWLATRYLVPGAVVAVAITRWLARRRAGIGGLMALEVVFFSLVMLATINDRLYGGLTPSAAEGPGQSAAFPADYLDRAYRLVALWIDGDYGVLRWGPFGALALWALWLLWRSRREHVSRAVPERLDAEVAASLLALVCAAEVFVAAFLSPTMFGFWFPGRYLIAALPVAAALAAWGLRHAPRVGALLGALTVAASAWLYLELRLGEGSWIFPPQRVPFGPLRDALPQWGTNSSWPTVVSIAVMIALLALVAREWRTRRQAEGMARRAHSG
ncbi:MAG: hypothetical protein ACR2ML_11330 [Solirubrobacteraceae bacterium]